MTRAIKQQRDLFVMMMQSQFWKWTRTNLKTKKEEITQVQGALRPVELWEYVFPEECMDEVFTMMNVQIPKGNYWGLSALNRELLRKGIGKDVQKIPKYNIVPTNKYVELRGVAIYPIGIKKDPVGELYDYKQELL